MAQASYERQHLAVHAAGHISAGGETVITFGCELTRISTGLYSLLLDAGSGLEERETFIMVTPRTDLFKLAAVFPISPTQKDIYVQDSGGSRSDCDLEITLFKSVTH